MTKLKKAKWANVVLWGSLAVLVMVVVATSIILHTKRKELEDLKNKNDIIKPEEEVVVCLKMENNKIFFKNFVILIDKSLNF